MSDTNLKQLEKLVESVKEIVEITQDKVEQVELMQHVTNGQVRMIKDQQSVMNKKLDGLEQRAKKLEETVNEQLLPSTLHTEEVLTGYGDMYKMNDDNIRKIEKRVITTEDKLKIKPSPEHILVDVQ